eukprot:TRINITY_DN2621_c0_g1_i2.p1 TRINITY_DN2621_c0_g1~~TRINITY_DN2621_c0_g1_i2.p1  ORF type:complete len:194 (-),score=38.94 TRINITY_DN2621_c0_g1_i2:168-749(-)
MNEDQLYALHCQARNHLSEKNKQLQMQVEQQEQTIKNYQQQIQYLQQQYQNLQQLSAQYQCSYQQQQQQQQQQQLTMQTPKYNPFLQGDYHSVKQNNQYPQQKADDSNDSTYLSQQLPSQNGLENKFNQLDIYNQDKYNQDRQTVDLVETRIFNLAILYVRVSDMYLRDSNKRIRITLILNSLNKKCPLCNMD